MDRKQLQPDPEYFEQLALALELEPGDRDEGGFVSPEEARRRSEAARTALHQAGFANEPEWFAAYQELLNGGWPWRVACYIAWSASPKKGRWPKTQEELATQVLGLTSDRQIGTWRKKNRSIDEVITILQAAPLMAHRADVLQALVEAASDPDHRNNPDRKLYLEMIGDYVPRAKVDVKRGIETDDLSELDEDELRRLMRQAKYELGEEDPDVGQG